MSKFSFGNKSATSSGFSSGSSSGFKFGGGSTTGTSTTGGSSTTGTTGGSKFSFGGGSSSSSTGTPAKTGFSFGAKNTTATSGDATGTAAGTGTGASGSTTTSTAPTTGSKFSFGGGSSSSTTGTTGGSRFSFGGSTSSNSSSTGSSSTGSLFGNKGTPGFGTGGGFSFGSQSGAAGGAAGAGGSADEVFQCAQAIHQAYDRTNTQNRFQFVFYNKINPGLANRMARPPHANPRLWELGVLNNPSPSTLTPCLVIGFDDLERRIQEQNKARQRYEDVLLVLNEKIAEMQKTHEQTVKTEVEAIAARHLKLVHRLTRLMSAVESQRAADLPLNEQEIDYRRKLEQVYRDLLKHGQFQAKIDELAAISRAMDGRGGAGGAGSDESGGALGSDSPFAGMGSSKQLDPASARHLYEFLDEHREYLERMVEEVSLAKKDVAAVVKKLDSDPL